MCFVVSLVLSIDQYIILGAGKSSSNGSLDYIDFLFTEF